MEKCDKTIINLIEKCDNCQLSECINCEISYTEVQEIKKLVDRVKELELENIALENTRNMSPHIKTSGISCNYKDSIPKSKIREKIGELDKQRIKMEKDDNGVGFTLGNEWSDLKAKIQVLQELLEDK